MPSAKDNTFYFHLFSRVLIFFIPWYWWTGSHFPLTSYEKLVALVTIGIPSYHRLILCVWWPKTFFVKSLWLVEWICIHLFDVSQTITTDISYKNNKKVVWHCVFFFFFNLHKYYNYIKKILTLLPALTLIKLQKLKDKEKMQKKLKKRYCWTFWKGWKEQNAWIWCWKIATDLSG